MNKRLIGLAVAIVAVGGAVAVFWPRHTAVAPAAPKQAYVALGDSVAAGVGLATDSDSSACNRTDESYPHRVASSRNLALTNLACSQATLAAGVVGAQDVNKLMAKPQLDQLFARAKPQLITLTIGANDAGWIGIMTKCYTGACGMPADTAEVARRLAAVDAGLRQALAAINTHYQTKPPRVVVTGYHQVFPATVASCVDLTGVDAAEQAWGRQQQTAINDMLSRAVGAFSFARFAAVSFAGHELCTADSWVQGTGEKQPYHPTEAGQKEYAKAVTAAVKER
jgi:lysophospholipase L1-like esterase